MDAKTFVGKKHAAAVDELKAIEAEYIPRKEAAQAMIEMTKKWLAELESDKSPSEPEASLQEVAKNAAANNWLTNQNRPS